MVILLRVTIKPKGIKQIHNIHKIKFKNLYGYKYWFNEIEKVSWVYFNI